MDLKRKRQSSSQSEEEVSDHQFKRLRMDRKHKREEDDTDQNPAKRPHIAAVDDEYPHFGLRKRQRIDDDTTTEQPKQKRQRVDENLEYWSFNHFLKQLHLENLFVRMLRSLWSQDNEPNSSAERDLLGETCRVPYVCH